MIRKCVDCGDQFELTQGEIDFYVQNNLNLPKRCKTCRKEKRELGFFDGYSSSLNTKVHTKGRTVVSYRHGLVFGDNAAEAAEYFDDEWKKAYDVCPEEGRRARMSTVSNELMIVTENRYNVKIKVMSGYYYRRPVT